MPGHFRRAFDEDASFTVRQGGLAESMGGIVLDDVVHRDAELVLSSIEVIKLQRVDRVGFLDGDRGELFDEHFFCFVEADRFVELRTEARIQACFPIGFVGKIF